MKAIYQESNNRGIIFFVFNIMISLIIAYAVNEFFLTDNLIFHFYSEQSSFETIEKMLEMRHEWSWLSYIFLIILYSLKILIIGLCLHAGLFFCSMEKKIQFRDLLTIVIKADLVFLIPSIIKILYFSFFEYTFSDFQSFYPLSLLSVLDKSTIEPWLIYPLQTLNLFEIIFLFILTFLLKKNVEIDFWKSMKLVSLSYGTGLIVWLVFIIFLNINNS